MCVSVSVSVSVCACVCVCVSCLVLWCVNTKSKLVTSVKGDPKAPFSIATTLWCTGGRYSIPWIAPLYPRSLRYKC